MTSLILKTGLPPGDVMTLTAAVEDLSWSYPGTFDIHIQCDHPAIWENNPWITPRSPESGYLSSPILDLDMEYPSIQESNQLPIPFISGYSSFLSRELQTHRLIDRPLKHTTNRPHLYLSEDEKNWISQIHELTGKKFPFWILNAGIKSDFTAKSWPLEYYHEVVKRTQGKIQWVQIGDPNGDHFHIPGTIDLIGKTDLRQLIRLVYHSSGGLGPITLLQHLCAAWEKPYVALLGGREPIHWTQYPKQHTLHTMGQLSCCLHGACWKSEVLEDCEQPILGLRRPSPRCMTLIKPEEVIHILERNSL